MCEMWWVLAVRGQTVVRGKIEYGLCRFPITMGWRVLRENNRRLGVLVIAGGVVLLLGLRFWASPVGRRITGRSGITVVEFLGIPLFLLVVSVGIALLLWEPGDRTA